MVEKKDKGNWCPMCRLQLGPASRAPQQACTQLTGRKKQSPSSGPLKETQFLKDALCPAHVKIPCR